MPRLLTGDMDNKMYVALEVALCCALAHQLAKNQRMEVKALVTGSLFAMYELYLQETQKKV